MSTPKLLLARRIWRVLRHGGKQAADLTDEGRELSQARSALLEQLEALRVDVQRSGELDNTEHEERLSEIKHSLDELRLKDEALIRRWKALNAKTKRRTVWVSMGNLLVEVVFLLVSLFVFKRSPKHAAAVHIEFYEAAAGIAPVLMVAGLVELALIRHTGGVWAVLGFSLPAVAAGIAALSVLATHKSTPITFSLGTWGLYTTTYALVSYFILHSLLWPRDD